MTFGRMQVHPGMEVVETDGDSIGRVSAVHGADFKIVRLNHEDVFVPFDAIRAMIGEQIVLGVHATDVDAQWWSSSPADGARA